MEQGRCDSPGGGARSGVWRLWVGAGLGYSADQSMTKGSRLVFWKLKFWMGLALVGALGAGCATIRVTDPPRTATEQFLMSEAIGKAVARLSVTGLRDRSVFVDSAYLYFEWPSQEQLFMLGELRARLLASGVRLVGDRKGAEIVLEVRSGGVGIDRLDYLLGIPAIYMPGAISGVAPIATPELAIIKNTRQFGFASIAVVAMWSDTGEWLVSSGPFVGRTFRSDWWFFGYGPRTLGNIPTTESPQ